MTTFQLSVVKFVSLLVLVLGISACGSGSKGPTAPSGGVGTLSMTVLEDGAPVAGAILKIAKNNFIVGEIGTDATGKAQTQLEYGTYSVSLDSFGLEVLTQQVKHESAETPIQFASKAKDDVELLEIYVNGEKVLPGGSMPRSGKIVLRGRHRQVTIPWPGTINVSARFLDSQSDNGTVGFKAGLYDTTNPTPSIWEVEIKEFNLTCMTCTSAKRAEIFLTRPSPPNGGVLVQLAVRKQEWPVTFH